MKNESYIDIIQNLVDTNGKEDLKKKWLKIVEKRVPNLNARLNEAKL